jgi:hypothetical protein
MLLRQRQHRLGCIVRRTFAAQLYIGWINCPYGLDVFAVRVIRVSWVIPLVNFVRLLVVEVDACVSKWSEL